MISLQTEVDRNLETIEDILRKNFEKSLFYPRADDKVRLLKLKVWSERHHVTIHYILSVLLPKFERMSKKYNRGTVSGKGIGTTISVLTGPSSEESIIEQITRDFPENEHIVSYRQDKQQEILLRISIDEGKVKTSKQRGLLAHVSVKSYVESYTERIAMLRNSGEKLERRLAKQPYRGNPFV